MITDNIKTHFSCAAYTEQTLACIVEGIGKSAKNFNFDFSISNFIIFFPVDGEILKY